MDICGNEHTNPKVYLTVYTTITKVFGIIKDNEVLYEGTYTEWKENPKSKDYKIVKETNDFDKGGHQVYLWVEEKK